MPDLLLAEAEIAALTGGLKLPRCQLRALRAAGFVRARLEHGRVILERAHYDAVCRGQFAAAPKSGDNPRPNLRPVSAAAKAAANS